MNKPYITSWDDVPVLIDLAMVSILTGKTSDTLWRMCSKGDCPAFKIGSEWYMKKEDLMDWIEDLKIQARERAEKQKARRREGSPATHDG